MAAYALFQAVRSLASLKSRSTPIAALTKHRNGNGCAWNTCVRTMKAGITLKRSAQKTS